MVNKNKEYAWDKKCAALPGNRLLHRLCSLQIILQPATIELIGHHNMLNTTVAIAEC